MLGRSTDVIIKGGVKIYPSKQETMLLKYDKLNKAVVCSIPDDRFQEEICACVVPSPGCDVTVEDLRAHCEQFQPRGMRIPLIPKHFIGVDHITTTAKWKGEQDGDPCHVYDIERILKLYNNII